MGIQFRAGLFDFRPWPKNLLLKAAFSIMRFLPNTQPRKFLEILHTVYHIPACASSFAFAAWKNKKCSSKKSAFLSRGEKMEDAAIF